MNRFVAFSVFFISIMSSGKEGKEIGLSPFQKSIQLCLTNQINAKKIKTLSELYKSLEKAYPLRTSETIYREVLFKEKLELKKLKLQNGKIALYKVNADQTVELLNNDARQKGLTEDSSMNQLLVRADIQSDWSQVKEIRANLTTLILGRQQGQLKSLSFEKAQEKFKLECSNIELSDICLCHL